MLQEASRLVQDGILQPIWTPHGPKLPPSWLNLDLCWPQVGSNLAQVGPMLAPSWLQLGSSWAHVGPRSGSPAAPEPTQTLPDPFPSPSRTHSRGYSPSTRPGQLDLEPWKYLLDLPNPQLGPQNCSTWLQKGPSQAPNPFSPGPVVGA